MTTIHARRACVKPSALDALPGLLIDIEHICETSAQSAHAAAWEARRLGSARAATLATLRNEIACELHAAKTRIAVACELAERVESERPPRRQRRGDSLVAHTSYTHFAGIGGAAW